MIKPDIVSVLTQEGIELKQHGKLYTAKCCFHDERTASLTVWPSDQRFKCFGCGESGDVIDFIQKLKEMSFLEAQEYLSIKSSPGGQKERETKKDLLARYKKWERERFLKLVKEYKDLIWEIENVKLDWELDVKSNFYHRLPVVEWQLDIFIEGTEKDKFNLFKGES
jgi:hypothetical protein